MTENFYRPIPQRSSFRPFSELLSETNEKANEEFQCLNDDIISQQSLESVPCTLFESEMQSVNIMHSDFPENQSTRVPQASTNLAKGQGSSSQQRVNRARWSIAETLILIDAKHREKDLYNTSGVMRKTKSSSEKWQNISIYCQANALERTATQCKDRCEHIQPDYKKINDYERNIPSGHDSYWQMTYVDRTLKKLPSKYNEDIFEAMENNFGQDRTINPGNLVEDTSTTDFGAFEDQLDPASHGIGIPEESNDINDDISAVRRQYKRKELDSRHNIDSKNRQVLEGPFGLEVSLTSYILKILYQNHMMERLQGLLMKMVDRVIEIKVPHQKKGQCELVLVGA
eukprot:Gb_02208 [translate_table: standard]